VVRPQHDPDDVHFSLKWRLESCTSSVADADLSSQSPQLLPLLAEWAEAGHLYLPFHLNGFLVLYHQQSDRYLYKSASGGSVRLAYRNSKRLDDWHSTMGLHDGETVVGTMEEAEGGVKWLKVKARETESEAMYGERIVGGPQFMMLSNLQDPEHPAPPRFRANPLRSEQLRTLHWMRARESSEERFDVDHEILDDQSWFHSSWRLRGRLRCSTRVRGGVLGDKVGYGKTATAIGLVSATLDEPAPQIPVGTLGQARIPSRATLVLCPVNLLQQWLGEVDKFVEDGLRVISVQTYAQLKRITVEELAEADMVVASYRLFYSTPYLDRLRELALAAGAWPGKRRKAPQAPRKRQLQFRSKKHHTFRSSADLLYNGRNPHSKDLPLMWPPRGGGRGENGPCCRKRSLRHFERDYARVIAKLEEAASFNIEDGDRSSGSRAQHFTASFLGKRTHPSKVVAKGVSQKLRMQSVKDAVPLELFYWKRIVLDEFHELTTGHPPAQVAARYLKSRCLWGLSGTPPCKTPSDVTKMAAHFRIFLRGFCNGPEVSRAVCQRWLNRFVRRNTTGLPELRAEEDIVLVRQHPAERALYLQLAQASSDADLAGEGNAATLVALRRRGLEGLVKLCSHFQLTGAQLQRSAKDECDAVLQTRRRELAAARTQLQKQYCTAWTRIKEYKPYCRGIFSRLTSADDFISDLTTSTSSEEQGNTVAKDDPVEAARIFARESLQTAKTTVEQQKGRSSSSATLPYAKVLQQHLKRQGLAEVPGTRASVATKEAYRRALVSFRLSRPGEQMLRETTQAHDKAKTAVNDAKRGLRALEARARLVNFFEATVRAARGEERLRCPICLDDVSPLDRGVLPCAHMGCALCLEETARRTKRCPVCRAAAQPEQVMRLELPDIERTESSGSTAGSSTEHGRFGSKIARLLRLLTDIAEREPDARAILFVQWEDLKRKVAGALSEFGVEHAVLHGSVWARQKTIERFQNGLAGEGPRVLLLSLQDSASGTNLTAASHVILFHPMISSSRQASVGCEMQAVGRALRAGQTRPVRIWRFVVAGTAEQRITEEHQQELWERFRAGTARVAVTTTSAASAAAAAGQPTASPSQPPLSVPIQVSGSSSSNGRSSSSTVTVAMPSGRVV